MNTWEWYNEHGQEFAARTRQQDVSKIRDPFVAMVSPGGHILDAGCGSGRDAKAFAEAGFTVTGIDPSSTMVQEARTLTAGLEKVAIEERSFAGITEESIYDGVWACSSLLHLPYREQLPSLQRLHRALKVGGVLYVTYKHGYEEGLRWEESGRYFTDMTFVRLSDLLQRAGFSPQSMFMSDLRGTPFWINALSIKS